MITGRTIHFVLLFTILGSCEQPGLRLDSSRSAGHVITDTAHILFGDGFGGENVHLIVDGDSILRTVYSDSRIGLDVNSTVAIPFSASTMELVINNENLGSIELSRLYQYYLIRRTRNGTATVQRSDVPFAFE
jgi:hypothetical protein